MFNSCKQNVLIPKSIDMKCPRLFVQVITFTVLKIEIQVIVNVVLDARQNSLKNHLGYCSSIGIRS